MQLCGRVQTGRSVQSVHCSYWRLMQWNWMSLHSAESPVKVLMHILKPDYILISKSWRWQSKEAVRQVTLTTTSGIKYRLFNLYQYFPKVTLGQSIILSFGFIPWFRYLVFVYSYPKNNNNNQYLNSTYFVPGGVLGVSSLLLHLILTALYR